MNKYILHNLLPHNIIEEPSL